MSNNGEWVFVIKEPQKLTAAPLGHPHDIYTRVPSDNSTSQNPRYDLFYLDTAECIVHDGERVMWGKFGARGIMLIEYKNGSPVMVGDDVVLKGV